MLTLIEAIAAGKQKVRGSKDGRSPALHAYGIVHGHIEPDRDRQLADSRLLGCPVLGGSDIEPIGEQFQAQFIVSTRYKKRLQR